MRTAIATEAARAASLSTATPATMGLLSRVADALAIRRQRRALLALDDRMLADVGLSRADAYREAHRPFLDMPSLTMDLR